MSLLASVKNTMRKAEAITIVASLLNHDSSTSALNEDVGALATRLVLRLWDSDSALYNGSSGSRPHQISVAAAALAQGAASTRVGSDVNELCMRAMCTLMSRIQSGENVADLKRIDRKVLRGAFEQITGSFLAGAPDRSTTCDRLPCCPNGMSLNLPDPT